MISKNEIIKPYVGTDFYVLGSTLECAKKLLKEQGIAFVQTSDIRENNGIKTPWIYLVIDENVSLCFVKGVLFEIVFENQFKGKLFNGAYIGMPMDELMALDSSIKYLDDDEYYSSDLGYWVEDDLDTNSVASITVFLKEVEMDDFFEYSWVSKYKNNN